MNRIEALATIEKQPDERQDYDVDFADWLAELDDTASSAAVEVTPAGIDLVAHSLDDSVVKVWLAGGVNRVRYKVTVTLTTAGARIKEAEFYVYVREV